MIEDLNSKLIGSINESLKNLCSRADLAEIIQFEDIETELNNFIKLFLIPMDKNDKTYNKKKKIFLKLLREDDKILNKNFVINENIKKLFEKKALDNWNSLYLIILSYLSYLKNSLDDKKINYVGMINKLYKKINEFEEISSDESPRKELNDSNQIVDNLLDDIKGMINKDSNIINISKNLGKKYQKDIVNGKIKFNDLVGEVMNLINDPAKINDKFKDFKSDNIENLNTELLVDEIKQDETFKDAFNLFENLNLSKGNGENTIFDNVLNMLKPKDDSIQEIDLNSIDEKIEDLLIELNEEKK